MKSIERKKYLDELISMRNNGMIKIITGMRRYGKSYHSRKLSLSEKKVR